MHFIFVVFFANDLQVDLVLARNIALLLEQQCGIPTKYCIEVASRRLDSTMIDLLNQSPKHEEDACQHPGLDSGESLRLGSVGGDVVEDVDQHQEQSDQECHPPRNHIHWDQERDPGHNNKET